MIRNKLASILADRNLKITKVSKETGISRNTITSTAQNDSKMIQLETINSICKYLEILPGDFFEYVPFDIKVQTYSNNFEVSSQLEGPDDEYPSTTLQSNFDIFLEIEEERGLKSSFDLIAKINHYSDNMIDVLNSPFVDSKYFQAKLVFDIDFEDKDSSVKFENIYWKHLSIPFQEEVLNNIARSLKSALIEDINDYIKSKEPFVAKSIDFLSEGNFVFNFNSETKYLNR